MCVCVFVPVKVLVLSNLQHRLTESPRGIWCEQRVWCESGPREAPGLTLWHFDCAHHVALNSITGICILPGDTAARIPISSSEAVHQERGVASSSPDSAAGDGIPKQSTAESTTETGGDSKFVWADDRLPPSNTPSLPGKGVCPPFYYAILGRTSVDIIKASGFKVSALQVRCPQMQSCAPQLLARTSAPLCVPLRQPGLSQRSTA